jgi:hypothetical protein
VLLTEAQICLRTAGVTYLMNVHSTPCMYSPELQHDLHANMGKQHDVMYDVHCVMAAKSLLHLVDTAEFRRHVCGDWPPCKSTQLGPRMWSLSRQLRDGPKP